jgi:hypothetical protein
MGCRFDSNRDDDAVNAGDQTIQTIQICTCGKHVWSIKGSRLLKADKNQCFFVNGERVDLSVFKGKNNKRMNSEICAALFNFLMALTLTAAIAFSFYIFIENQHQNQKLNDNIKLMIYI